MGDWAVEASAVAGAAISTAAAITAIMSFRRVEIVLLSLLLVRPRNGGRSAIDVGCMIIPSRRLVSANGCRAFCLLRLVWAGISAPRLCAYG
jgi:hypothetical protein